MTGSCAATSSRFWTKWREERPVRMQMQAVRIQEKAGTGSDNRPVPSVMLPSIAVSPPCARVPRHEGPGAPGAFRRSMALDTPVQSLPGLRGPLANQAMARPGLNSPLQTPPARNVHRPSSCARIDARRSESSSMPVSRTVWENPRSSRSLTTSSAFAIFSGVPIGTCGNFRTSHAAVPRFRARR